MVRNLYESKFYDQLVEITERLVAVVMIDQIYFADHEYNGMKRQQLIVLLSDTDHLHIVETKSFVGKVINKYSRFMGLVYYIHEIMQTIKDGDASLVFHCRPDNLIYINPGAGLFINKIESKKCILKKAYENFKLEENKVKYFREGVVFYYNNNQLQLCAFMLHQVFELSYRMAEIVFLGKGRITHKVQSHHNFMVSYVPELATILDRNKDIELISLLDKAYLTVRYENNYHISKLDLDYLIMKSIDIQDLLTRACTEIIEYYSISSLD